MPDNLAAQREVGIDLSPKTLVLLPGLDGTGNLFTNFVAALPPALNTRIVRYPTDRFLNYTELLSCALDATPTADSFVVLAESFSTPLAVKLAATRLANLAGLVICAGFITNPVGRWRPLVKALVGPSFFRIPAPGFLVDHFLIGANAPHELRDAVGDTLRSVSPEVMALRIRALMACDAREEMVQVQVPILYLQAALDRLVKERSFEEIRRLKPDTILASIPAPHFALQREPHKAVDLILHFVQRLSRG
jgi:pimeloyl-[acyl-carrier protein] methyl ester esterase